MGRREDSYKRIYLLIFTQRLIKKTVKMFSHRTDRAFLLGSLTRVGNGRYVYKFKTIDEDSLAINGQTEILA